MDGVSSTLCLISREEVSTNIHHYLNFCSGLSVLQQVIDMIYNGLTKGDWSFFGSGGDAFNVVKFMLGITAVFFDIIFMIQHFILYRHPPSSPEEDMLIEKPIRHSILAEEDDDEFENGPKQKVNDSKTLSNGLDINKTPR